MEGNTVAEINPLGLKVKFTGFLLWSERPQRESLADQETLHTSLVGSSSILLADCLRFPCASKGWIRLTALELLHQPSESKHLDRFVSDHSKIATIFDVNGESVDRRRLAIIAVIQENSSGLILVSTRALGTVGLLLE